MREFPFEWRWRRAQQRHALRAGSASVAERKLIEDIVGITGQAFGLDQQFASQIIKAGNMQRDATHAGQVALTRLIVSASQQSTMNSHRLGSVFNAIGGTKTAFGTQWITCIGMAERRAGNRRFRPVEYRVKQAHAALMRDVGGDPGVV
jgi:hypothetical protein